MNLLYAHEHLACKNYVSDYHIGFSYWEAPTGQIIRTRDKYFNYIFFFLEGEALVTCNEHTKQLLKGSEMLFVNQNDDFLIEPLTDLKYIMLSFDNQYSLCEQFSLEYLRKEGPKEPTLSRIDIRPPMQTILDSVIFYLGNKILCKHLHSIKQKEVFIILRAFYTKAEMAAFLWPLLNKNMDFKAFVLQHYQEVKTVEELAAMCKISARSFNRKFNDYFNDSPYSWMLKQKSRHIKNRLADSSVNFSSIIKEYGFSSPAHFTTYCKKQFGVSPSKYRKQLILELKI